MPREARKQHLYDPTGNWYKVPDWLLEQAGRGGQTVWLPAVSTILDVYQAPSLRVWYGKMGIAEAERIKNETATWGTHAHALIERIIGGEKIQTDEWNALPEKVRQCLRAWIRWYQIADFHPAKSEMAVYSLKYGYAGTLDATGYFGKIWGIADWKTSSSEHFFSRTNWLQIAAYYNAYHEMFPDQPRVKTIRLVSLNRETGNFKEHPYTPKQARTAFYHFIYARRVWDFVRREYDEQERDTALSTA